MTDKYKQIADCYGPGDFNDLHAIDIEDYVLKAAKDVHLMWDEIQRLRRALALLPYECPITGLSPCDGLDENNCYRNCYRCTTAGKGY
jgi:hypothetical protein